MLQEYWNMTFINSVIYKLCTLFSKNMATLVSSVDSFEKKILKKNKNLNIECPV